MDQWHSTKKPPPQKLFSSCRLEADLTRLILELVAAHVRKVKLYESHCELWYILYSRSFRVAEALLQRYSTFWDEILTLIRYRYDWNGVFVRFARRSWSQLPLCRARRGEIPGWYCRGMSFLPSWLLPRVPNVRSSYWRWATRNGPYGLFGRVSCAQLFFGTIWMSQLV